MDLTSPTITRPKSPEALCKRYLLRGISLKAVKKLTISSQDVGGPTPVFTGVRVVIDSR